MGISIPEFAAEFAWLIADLVDLLDKYDGALGRMKIALENLVLPQPPRKKLVYIVPSHKYKEATSVEELFKLLTPYWSCIDCKLLHFIVKASNCQQAMERLDKFLHHGDSISPSLVVYSPAKANTSEPAKEKTSEFQCTSILSQPTKSETVLKTGSSVEVEAKVDTDFLTLKDYDEKTSLLCGVLRLPRFALSYLRFTTGCVLLTWQMSADLVEYVQSVQLTNSDLQLLAKYGFTNIKIANSYQTTIPKSSFWKTAGGAEVSLVTCTTFKCT